MKKQKKLTLATLALLTFFAGNVLPHSADASVSYKKSKKKIVRRVKKTNAKLASASTLSNTPFVYQATVNGWSDPVLSEGCEESAVLMAKLWSSGTDLSEIEKRDEILAMSRFEENRFGSFVDTSAGDTAILAKEYYNLPASVRYDIGIAEIKKALSAGNLVIVPVNGRLLANPYYLGSGPPRHTIVITSYDSYADEFIINDPGTRYGHGQRFSSSRLNGALQDYSTGNHGVLQNRTAMIEVVKDRISLTQ